MRGLSGLVTRVRYESIRGGCGGIASPGGLRGRRCLTASASAPALATSFSNGRNWNKIQADYDHVIIGAGIIGLSLAARLSLRGPTLLLERHPHYGTETSSRNSEVIHAGLYYPTESLKTELCIRGREMLYEFCGKYNVGHKKTGKWVVAQDEEQFADLEGIRRKAGELGVRTRWVGLDEARVREPDVRARVGVLESPETGIVDSHGLMTCLAGIVSERGGDLALGTEVTGLSKLADGGYEIQTRSGGEEMTISTSTLINSAGLHSIPISNLLLPPSRHLTPHYAKGTYYTYALSRPRPRTLIYPAPIRNLGGLGTHLTLDLSGRIRFGPDIKWIDRPDAYAPDEGQMSEAVRAIKEYLPGIDASAIAVDYCGIRPKLGPKGSPQKDFYIREEEGYGGFINLLGMESPGLTSSFAIAEKVEGMLYGSASKGLV